MRERVEAVQVAQHDLRWNEDGDERHGHRHHPLRFNEVPAVLHVPRCDAENSERRRQVEPRDGMHQPVRKRRIEDDRKPTRWKKAPVDQLVALRRVHPAVERKDPERREQRSERDHQRREKMRPWRNQLAAEQQDAQEPRFEEERHHAFVSQKGSEDVAAYFREAAPIGAELKRHHDARHDTHAERHGKDPRPEHRQAQIDRIALDDVQSFEQNDE